MDTEGLTVAQAWSVPYYLAMKKLFSGWAPSVGGLVCLGVTLASQVTHPTFAADVKRAVVQKYRDGLQAQPDGFHVGQPDVAEALIAALASVFAEHPDFNPEWLAAVDWRPERPDNVVQFPRHAERRAGMPD